MHLKELFRIFDFGLINFNVERFYELVLYIVKFRLVKQSIKVRSCNKNSYVSRYKIKTIYQ